jgi:hypothetical protein
LIVGDMNLDYNKKLDPSYHHRKIFDIWRDFEESNDLVQLVNFNTWARTNRGLLQQSRLDHVYTNNIGQVESVEEGSAPISDHTPVIIKMAQRKVNGKRKIWIRDWSKYSKEELLSRLSLEDWNINCVFVQDFNERLERQIMSAIDILIPFRQRTINELSRPETQRIRNLKKKRKRVYQNAKRRSSAVLLQRSKKMGKQITQLLQGARRNTIRNKIFNGNQQGLWQAFRLAEGRATETIPEQIVNGNISTNQPEERAQLFADFFKNKVEKIVTETVIDPNVSNGDKVIHSNNKNFFSLLDVEQVILSLKPKNCYGYDNIPLRILKDGISILLKPMHELMNLIYQQHYIPDQWRISRVIPLHKKGSKSKVENYRPISNLCAGSKVFEKLVLARFLEFDADTLFTNNQHGFRKNRSTITAAKELQSLLAAAMDRNEFVAVASLDLTAAFDVINIDLLLTRLATMGMPDDLVSLMAAWLQDRMAYVEVDGYCSEFYEVQNGTVQGSVLGPILFNLFIRQLLVESKPICFADDGYYFSCHADKVEAARNLEVKVMTALKWLMDSGLKVNIAKTELTLFHRFKGGTIKIKIGEMWIESKNDMKVLGMVFDSRLDWYKQVDVSVLKARRTSQALKVVGKYFTEKERANLVTSLVFSKLYYGSEVWLLPNLKERHFSRLYSQSGRALKIINKELTFKELHKVYSRATPKIFSIYQTCICYYNLFKNQDLLRYEHEMLKNVVLNDRRNVFFSFVRANHYKVGLNNISNRLRSVSNFIEKERLKMSKESFKMKCKINVIQVQLSLL